MTESPIQRVRELVDDEDVEGNFDLRLCADILAFLPGPFRDHAPGLLRFYQTALNLIGDLYHRARRRIGARGLSGAHCPPGTERTRRRSSQVRTHREQRDCGRHRASKPQLGSASDRRSTRANRAHEGGRSPGVNIEFSSPLPPELIPRLDEAFTVWDHLVFLGGYRFSFEPDDDFNVVLGETTQPTRTSVRHIIDSFRGPLLALDGPLRICRHLVRHGYSVKEILMEG